MFLVRGKKIINNKQLGVSKLIHRCSLISIQTQCLKELSKVEAKEMMEVTFHSHSVTRQRQVTQERSSHR